MGKAASSRKGAKEGYRLCVGGPFHGERIRSEFVAKHGRDKRLVASLPDRFRLEGWAGSYQLAPSFAVYVWVDDAMSLADHVRLLQAEADKRAKKADKEVDGSSQ
jgi:hypothetical protein